MKNVLPGVVSIVSAIVGGRRLRDYMRFHLKIPNGILMVLNLKIQNRTYWYIPKMNDAFSLMIVD